MRVALLAAAAAVLLLVLAGCGSSRLSHKTFVERANAICGDYKARVDKLRRPRSLIEIEKYTRQTLAVYREALGQLEALRPPKFDELTVEQWLAVDRQIALDVEKLADAAKRRSIPDVQAATNNAATHDRRSNQLAAQIGLSTCIAS
jgi:hypothetical protein